MSNRLCKESMEKAIQNYLEEVLVLQDEIMCREAEMSDLEGEISKLQYELNRQS